MCRTWSDRSRHSSPPAGVNIADLLNKSRGEYAYTLIDADGSIDAATFAAVRGIHGVLAARLIKGED